MRRLGVVVALMLAGRVGVASAGSHQAAWGKILIVGDEFINHSSVYAHSSVYVAELYDPVSNRFTLTRPLVDKGSLATPATVISMGRNRGNVLLPGGDNDFGSMQTTELYEPATNRFIRGPRLTTYFGGATATIIPIGPKAGWILIVDTSSDLYDPVRSRFVAGPEPLYNGNNRTATVIPAGPHEGAILLAGGLISPSDDAPQTQSSGNESEIYEPLSNRFVPGPPLNEGRWWHTATVIRSGSAAGKILLAGGYSVDSSAEPMEALASTELYDPATNTFAPRSATATMLTPRGSHTATVITTGPNAGKILIAGGEQNDRDALASTELYDPMANTFTAGPPLASPRTQHLAITITTGPNAGKILIAGGFVTDRHNRTWCGDPNYYCDYTPLASTELYDPLTNTFAPGPRMHEAPGDAVAVQLPPAPQRSASIRPLRSQPKSGRRRRSARSCRFSHFERRRSRSRQGLTARCHHELPSGPGSRAGRYRRRYRIFEAA